MLVGIPKLAKNVYSSRSSTQQEEHKRQTHAQGKTKKTLVDAQPLPRRDHKQRSTIKMRAPVCCSACTIEPHRKINMACADINTSPEQQLHINSSLMRQMTTSTVLVLQSLQRKWCILNGYRQMYTLLLPTILDGATHLHGSHTNPGTIGAPL